jgi:hypothetical protein
MAASEALSGQFDYRGSHQPPSEGAPLHDLSYEGYYPADVYSDKGVQYYGGSPGSIESRDMKLAQSYRNQPDRPVTIYRAAPKGVEEINPGDWVAISREYAEHHGEGRLNGNYTLLSKTVPAKHVRTPADSPSEWGYFPHS